MELFPDHLRSLKHLAREYPSPEAAAEAIINLKAQLNLPKGTEHFISDIHGEYEAFSRVVSHASGSIKRKIAELFKDDLAEQNQLNLGALIYQPETMVGVLMPGLENQEQWFQQTLLRLIQVLRSVSSKYSRYKVQ